MMSTLSGVRENISSIMNECMKDTDSAARYVVAAS